MIQQCLDIAAFTDPIKIVEEPLAASVDFLYTVKMTDATDVAK